MRKLSYALAASLSMTGARSQALLLTLLAVLWVPRPTMADEMVFFVVAENPALLPSCVK